MISPARHRSFILLFLPPGFFFRLDPPKEGTLGIPTVNTAPIELLDSSGGPFPRTLHPFPSCNSGGASSGFITLPTAFSSNSAGGSPIFSSFYASISVGEIQVYIAPRKKNPEHPFRTYPPSTQSCKKFRRFNHLFTRILPKLVPFNPLYGSLD